MPGCRDQFGCRRAPTAPVAHRRADRYRATRAEGVPPVNRSPITATDAAPASSTARAVSSVMPPIATIGSRRPRRGIGDELEPDGLVARVLRDGAEHRTDRNVVDRVVQRRVDLRRACASRRRRRPQVRGTAARSAGGRSSWPTCTARRLAASATSKRSLTTITVPDPWARLGERRGSSPAAARLGASLARSWMSRAPPASSAFPSAGTECPARSGRLFVDDRVERRERQYGTVVGCCRGSRSAAHTASARRAGVFFRAPGSAP